MSRALVVGTALAILLVNVVVGASFSFFQSRDRLQAARIAVAADAGYARLLTVRERVEGAWRTGGAAAVTADWSQIESAADGARLTVLDAADRSLGDAAPAAPDLKQLLAAARRAGSASAADAAGGRLLIASSFPLPDGGERRGIVLLDTDIAPTLEGVARDTLLEVLPFAVLLPVLGGAGLCFVLLTLGPARQRRDARAAELEDELRRCRHALQLSQEASGALQKTLDREVRTAMSSIIGFSQIIELSSGTDFNSARNAHKIYLAGHDLMYMLDTIAGIRQQEEPEPEEEPVDAGSLASLLAGCRTEDEGQAAAVPRKPAAPRRPGNGGILVVEDDFFNQEVIKEQIGMIGLPVEAVASGEEALACWRDYSIIVTDINMPGIDGYELARTIRAEEAGAEPRVAIIALTANTGPDEAQRCKDAGMDDYLAKPVDFMLLKKKLAEWG